jgi:phenylacetic acid degradation protein
MPFYSFEGVVPVVDPTSYVHPTASVIGDVIIGPGCYIAAGAALRGDMGRLVVGKGSNVQDNCIMHGIPGRDTEIGEDGHIGHGAILHGCKLGRDVLVGMNAVVLDGAEVGEGAMVAAMALVRGGAVIPPATLVAGIPARPVRELGEADRAYKQAATREYQELARISLRSVKPVEPLTAVEPNRPRVEASKLLPPYLMKQRAG